MIRANIRIGLDHIRYTGHRLRGLLQSVVLAGRASTQHSRTEQHHFRFACQQNRQLTNVRMGLHEERILAETTADGERGEGLTAVRFQRVENMSSSVLKKGVFIVLTNTIS